MAIKPRRGIYLVIITKSVNKALVGFTFRVEVQVEIANQKLTALLALWNDKRGARSMPSRADLTVTTLKPWLGNLALIDLPADGLPMFRLCGTGLHARFGGEQTKHKVETLDDDIGRSFRECIDHVRRTRNPNDSHHERTVSGAKVGYRELCLPLSDEGEEVHSLLFASYQVRLKG
jgi:hypothetical protein